MEKTCEHCGKAFGPSSDSRSARSYFRREKRYCSATCAAKASAIRTPLIERFWTYLTPRGEDDCWEWSGARQTAGYGAINDRNVVRAAHRLSWEIHNGPIPTGAHVLHRCDNPPCCNPKHLFLGTPADNDADKRAKGRANHTPIKGEAHGMSKLNESDVLTIRASKGSTRAIAERFNVSTMTIYYIRSRRTWKHI